MTKDECGAVFFAGSDGPRFCTLRAGHSEPHGKAEQPTSNQSTVGGDFTPKDWPKGALTSKPPTKDQNDAFDDVQKRAGARMERINKLVEQPSSKLSFSEWATNARTVAMFEREKHYKAEIDRLTRELHAFTKHVPVDTLQMIAENNRLTRERDEAMHKVNTLTCEEENRRLRAEIEAMVTWYGLENEAARKRGTRPTETYAAPDRDAGLPIAALLRKKLPVYFTWYPKKLEEAADEIEHLQEQEAALREIHREDQAEIERLSRKVTHQKDELARLNFDNGQQFKEIQHWIARAQDAYDENKRLRANAAQAVRVLAAVEFDGQAYAAIQEATRLLR